jgi:hypothetical protein
MGGGIFVFPDNGVSANPEVAARITALENETIKRGYYQVVTGTSGSISKTSGVTFVAGQFGSSGNSIVSQINGSNYPIYNSPTDVSGNPVTSTLNTTSGAWTTSATYIQSSIAIFFVVTGTQINIDLFEATYPGYIREVDIENELVAGSGISIVTNVISVTGVVTSVAGTSNRITSTGGTTPVIDISASYVGQSSITTLGTIATGVWNGTAIANANLANSSLTINGTSVSLGASGTVTAAAGTLTGTTLNSTVVTSSLTSVGTIGTGVWQGALVGSTYGGTGVNNGVKTITLGGNLVTTGAFNLTLAVPQTTTYTLPNTASETLAGLATAQTFTAVQRFTGATTEITALALLDTTYKTVLDISAANTLRLANGMTTPTITTPATVINVTGGSTSITSTTGGLNLATSSGGNTVVLRVVGDANANSGVNITMNGSATNGSSNRAITTVNGTYAPTTGTTAIFRGINLSPTINETSTAANELDLLDINPTLTSVRGTVYGVRSRLASSPTGGGTAWNLYIKSDAGTTAQNYIDGNTGIGTTTVTAAFLTIAAGTTAKSQINFISSTAPSSPNNGDFWFDGTDVKIRVGGVTKTFTLV